MRLVSVHALILAPVTRLTLEPHWFCGQFAHRPSGPHCGFGESARGRMPSSLEHSGEVGSSFGFHSFSNHVLVMASLTRTITRFRSLTGSTAVSWPPTTRRKRDCFRLILLNELPPVPIAAAAFMALIWSGVRVTCAANAGAWPGLKGTMFIGHSSWLQFLRRTEIVRSMRAATPGGVAPLCFSIQSLRTVVEMRVCNSSMSSGLLRR